jgi:hypothetical protein
MGKRTETWAHGEPKVLFHIGTLGLQILYCCIMSESYLLFRDTSQSFHSETKHGVRQDREWTGKSERAQDSQCVTRHLPTAKNRERLESKLSAQLSRLPRAGPVC